VNGQEREVVRAGYDAAAPSYLAARPSDGADVALLDELISRLTPGARVLDAGCGAGQPVSDRLVATGLTTTGLDLAWRQVAMARTLVPAITVAQADLAALPFSSGAFAAVVSYYAIIHVPRDEHPSVLAEIRRVLATDGLALLCLGAKDLPADDDPDSWLGTPMFWSHFDAGTNLRLVVEAGFTVGWHRIVEDPMHHGRHLFVLARVL
jgi:SAM-dependent methyltransferase